MAHNTERLPLIDKTPILKEVEANYPHLTDKSLLKSSPNLLPGDPGWTPPEKPGFYNSQEEFNAAWDLVNSTNTSVEQRLRRRGIRHWPSGRKPLKAA